MRLKDIDSHYMTPDRGLTYFATRYLRRHNPTAKEFRITLKDAFSDASGVIDGVKSIAAILGGTPCIRGTRVPVYMVLDAIEHHGTLQGALHSYPQLSIEQVKDAVRFAKLVMERPVDHQAKNSH